MGVRGNRLSRTKGHSQSDGSQVPPNTCNKQPPFSLGNGTITINYGHPAYVKALGGFSNVVFPEIAHEYTHEMFHEISHMFLGNFSCLNEGLANAVAVTAGFTPPEKLGPIGLRQGDFRDGCIADDEIHDRGDCCLFNIKQVGLLTPQFIFKVFHPLHTYAFDSCTMNEQTGNGLFVLFHESANGADVRPALDAMKLPHAASYDEAKVALGL